MPTLAEKKAVVEEITQQIKECDALYVTDYKGMSVAEMNELRSEFTQKGVTYKICRNTLFRRAVDEVDGLDELKEHMVYQNAVAFVTGDPSVPAKIIKQRYKDKKEKPAFKLAVIDGVLYDEKQLDHLAAMKSKEEVVGDIVGLLLSPASNVVSALQAQGSNLAGAIKSIADKEEDS